MNRILIIGCPGSGKTTLSKILSDKLQIPLVHLDKMFWNSGWQPKSREEFDAELLEVLQTKRWIIDGNYSRTIPWRMEKADMVIHLDYPTAICVWRVLKRVVTRYGETRSDMGENCPERFDMEFLKYVWGFRKNQRPKLLSCLQDADDKKIVTIQSEQERKAFLKSLEEKTCM